MLSDDEEFQRLARQLMDQDAGVRQYALDASKVRALSGWPRFLHSFRCSNQSTFFSKGKCARALSLVGPDVIAAMWSLLPPNSRPKKREKTFRAESTAALDRLRNELK